MKDSQKRYLYDSGVTTDGSEDDIYTGDVNWEAGRKYYENKWYGFQKNKYTDQRDEFYENKFGEKSDIPPWLLAVFDRRILTVVLLGAGFFSYDYYRNRMSRKDVEREHAKNLLEGTEPDKKTKKLNRYISQRAKLHQV